MVTKKRLALITIVMFVVYFALFFSLPESIVKARGQSNLLLFSKIGFLSATAAIVSAIIFVIIFKRDFFIWQFESFNRYKHLLKLLVKRDFISRYRKSVLGVLWSLLNPLLTMLVMNLIFSYLFRFEIENYPVYLLSGQIVFGFFSESTNLSMYSVIGAEGTIKKIYVPKWIFPVSRVVSSLVNLCFSLLALIFVIVITKAPLRAAMLLMPIPIIYTFIFSLGVSMLLSSMAVFFRDLTYLYGIFITLLMYLTPLFYPVEILPERLMALMGLNPLYHFVGYARALTVYGVVPDPWTNMVCLGYALAALCCGTYIFMSKQERFILSL